MNENTLINTLINDIADDQTLSSWCAATYGRRHKVYKGIDERNPPDPTSDYPAVNVTFERQHEGYSLEQREHEVVISGGLYDADFKTRARDNIVEYEFSENLADFANYVKDVIKASSLTGLELSELEIFYFTIEFFPSLKFEMYATFTQQYYQGDDPFD